MLSTIFAFKINLMYRYIFMKILKLTPLTHLEITGYYITIFTCQWLIISSDTPTQLTSFTFVFSFLPCFSFFFLFYFFFFALFFFSFPSFSLLYHRSSLFFGLN
ncbi:Uncharacterized protein TCM_023991 [Theobroma cacao]|uniref:Uncharacterized protein n=1 Tax=Theobroma cacao TaxID=3641 RepID=A0A061F2R1_THECC|nr:Uncharacterized protein TCM_023991 [Theobroma cacao]